MSSVTQRRTGRAGMRSHLRATLGWWNVSPGQVTPAEHRASRGPPTVAGEREMRTLPSLRWPERPQACLEQRGITEQIKGGPSRDSNHARSRRGRPNVSGAETGMVRTRVAGTWGPAPCSPASSRDGRCICSPSSHCLRDGHFSRQEVSSRGLVAQPHHTDRGRPCRPSSRLFSQ